MYWDPKPGRSESGDVTSERPHEAEAPDAQIIARSGLFEEPVEWKDAQRMVLAADVVIGVENTRAIVLSWPEDVRRGFTEELRHYLRSQAEVHLTQMTSLTMARVLRYPD